MFVRVLNSPLRASVISPKGFILDVWQGSEYASAIYFTIGIRHFPIRSVAYFFTKFA